MRDWLAATASARPTSEAVHRIYPDPPDYPSHSDTYALVNERTAEWVERLKLAGIQPGDRIGILEGSATIHTHAVARLGAVLVPLNSRLTVDELRYQIETVGCKIVLSDFFTEKKAKELRLSNCVVYGGSIFNFTDLPKLPEPDDTGFEAETWRSYLDGEINLGAVQSIIFTSGTSGKPKGVQITFGNLYHSALASAERLGASPDDRWFCPLPFYHVGGMSIVFRSVIYGSSIVIPDTTGTEAIIKGLRDSQATIVSLVPTQLYRMLEAGFEPSPPLRLILLGGAAASPELVQRCIERNLPVALTYGLTEAASQVATATPEQVRAKPGSVGKPLSGTTVRVVDEQGNEQPAGEYGEIVVSGATVMRGYLGQPPTNGTIHTGDIGYLDTDGDLWLVQRRSDLIVSGGENVYPSEVEGVLRQHPAVADACVVGVPDAEWGQRVAAMIALQPSVGLTEAALIAFSRERLAGYKQPRRIVFVGELPQTASGKVQRSKVQEMLLAMGD